MTFKKLMLASIIACGVATTANAADKVYTYDFNQAVARAVADGTLDGSVKFYLHGASPRASNVLQRDIVTNQKTNGFGKDASVACDWVLRSALKQLEKAAKAQGGNAVVNITSYFRKNERRSASTYECYKGMAVASVALKGDIVKR